MIKAWCAVFETEQSNNDGSSRKKQKNMTTFGSEPAIVRHDEFCLKTGIQNKFSIH